MGLDIHIMADNHKELRSADYYDEKNDYFKNHSLSRTFCNFMCRQNVISHEPELDQIGHITGVDITPIYEMEQYPEDDDIEFFHEDETQEKKQKILAQAKKDREKLKGNIDNVLLTINKLIEELNQIDNLPALLTPTDFDSLENEEYFGDFKIDKRQGYIDNNFGQDLRNFKRYLEFAKSKGTTTVWFWYG